MTEEIIEGGMIESSGDAEWVTWNLESIIAETPEMAFSSIFSFFFFFFIFSPYI